MTIKRSQSRQTIAELSSLSKSKVKVDNEDITPNDEYSSVNLNNTKKSLDELDIDKILLSIEEEYDEEEKPFLREIVVELASEGIGIDVPKFYLLAARKILSKRKELLSKLIEEQKVLLKKLESAPNVRTKLTLQSYVQDAVINSESAFEYLTVCGSIYLYCMKDKLELLGLEIKEGSPIADKISTMNKTLKNDTRNALAATIRAFSGINTDSVIHGISTKRFRKEAAKTARHRWLIDEAVKDILNTTTCIIVETTEQVKLPENLVGEFLDVI